MCTDCVFMRVCVCVWSSSGLTAECWLAWCNLTNTMRADGMGWNPAMPGSVSGVLKAAGVTVEHRSTHISHQPTPLWLLVCCQCLILRNHCRSQANTIIEGGNPGTSVPAVCVYTLYVWEYVWGHFITWAQCQLASPLCHPSPELEKAPLGAARSTRDSLTE